MHILLASSVCMLTSTIAMYIPHHLFWLYIVGGLTSIWNHGLATPLAGKIDRAVMRIGGCVDMYHIVHHRNPIAFVTFVMSLCSFFATKYSIYVTFWHFQAHAYIIISHTIQLWIIQNHFFHKRP